MFLYIFQTGCKKADTFDNNIKPQNNLSIKEAKEYFDKHFLNIEEHDKSFSRNLKKRGNDRSRDELIERQAMWDGAKMRDLSIGTNAVLLPLSMKGVYVHISPTRMVKYGFLNYLMMYKNKHNEIITEWVELKPTEEWIDSKVAIPYEGRILVKNWDGKVKKVYSYGNVKAISKTRPGIERRSGINGDFIRDSGDEGICWITTTYTITVSPQICPCDGHSYGQIDICQCSIKPRQGYLTELEELLEIDCEDPVDPWGGPIGGGGGTGGPGGSDHGEGGGNGGGTPGSGDYQPSNCNPDPDYVMPTIPPPPGTEYILPCSGIDIPVEDIPGADEDEDEDDSTIPPFIWTYTGDSDEDLIDNFPSNKPSFQFLPSDNYETKYPRFTELVKNLKSFVMSNRKVLSALQKWTGFSQNEIIEHLSFGNGPIIKIVPMSGAYGYFNGSENPAILNIRQNYVDALEVAPFSYTRESLSFLLSVTVLHEFVHLGAHVNGISEGAYEFGNNFEKEAFNVIVNTDNLNRVYINFAKYH